MSSVSLPYLQATYLPHQTYRANLSASSSPALNIPLGDATLSVFYDSTSEINYSLIPVNTSYGTVVDVFRASMYLGLVSADDLDYSGFDSYTLTGTLAIDNGSYNQSNELWQAFIRVKAQDSTWSTYFIHGFSSASGARTTVSVTTLEAGVTY